ncbi:multiheme c-type cytochrome [Candidatus Latescibacterota bacterium]
MKRLVLPLCAVFGCALIFLLLMHVSGVESQNNSIPLTPKKVEIKRGLTRIEQECIECHAKEEPGKIGDWSHGLHARSNVTCLDCHQAELTDKDARDCPGTKKYRDLKISPIVTPLDCARCHPFEEELFSQSKHSRTFTITADELQDPWMKGMANEIERSVGCNICHGSDISSGELTEANWPNEGCGRINPDGSFGTCTICHTTHIFSIAEARKPDTCGQCHLGPDHPQNEIYFESKHGKRYLAEGASWNFETAPDAWEPGSDFSAPTCAACHMSGIGPLSTTHDVGERLKWEAQMPLTVMNKDYDGNAEREKMITVCTQCHSPRWSNNYLNRYDSVIENYNENYFKPVKKIVDGLYAKNLLTPWPVFDEEIEWAFYEYWHHEGRRARMGSAMMGPDYSWWHGFYELKKSYQEIIRLADEVVENGHGSPVYVPGSGGKNLTPANVAPLPEGWDKVKNLNGRP